MTRRQKLHRLLLKLWLKFKYRNQDDDVCCCGGYVSGGRPYLCEGQCRSLKEYTITKELEKL